MDRDHWRFCFNILIFEITWRLFKSLILLRMISIKYNLLEFPKAPDNWIVFYLVDFYHVFLVRNLSIYEIGNSYFDKMRWLVFFLFLLSQRCMVSFWVNIKIQISGVFRNYIPVLSCTGDLTTKSFCFNKTRLVGNSIKISPYG